MNSDQNQNKTDGDSLRKNWKTLAVLIFCVFLGALDFQIMGSLIPVIMASLGESSEQGGLLITVFSVTAGIIAFCGGPVSDRWGRKNMILVGCAMTGTAAFLMGMSNHFIVFLVTRGVAGMGAALILPNCFALGGDLFPYQQRGMVMGVLIGGAGAAAILGVPLGTSIAQFFSWNWTFWGMGEIAILLLLLVSFMIPQHQLENQKSVGGFSYFFKHFHHVFSLPSLFWALFAMFLWYGGLMGFFQNFGIYYAKTFGFNVGKIGLLFFVPGVTYFLGSIVGGKISDTIGKKQMVFFAGLWATNAALAFAVVSDNFLVSTVVIGIWGGCFGMGESSLVAIISELGKDSRGTALSLNNTFIYASTAFITFISSLFLPMAKNFTLIGVISAFSLFSSFLVVKFLIKDHFIQPSS